VNTLAQLLHETPTTFERPRVRAVHEQIESKVVSQIPSVRDGQIRNLVQQLFFRRESKPVRHVGFAAVDGSTMTATLCLDVASTLAAEGCYDVALIDTYPGAAALHTELQISSPIEAAPTDAESSWTIAPRLWIVARQHWLPDPDVNNLTDQNLSRLREVMSDFDFSILRCGPVTWSSESIARACDGLALVLTANKTRRLVAAQTKDQLRKAQVPVLGTILADRRFPVPQGLYRSL
jgi:hypothetical protein